MIALIRAELLKWRSTRAAWALAGLAVALTVAGVAAALAGVGGVGAAPRGSTRLRDELLGVAGFGLYPILLLGVVTVTGEFRHRTLAPTLLVTPARRRVILAKLAAAAVAGPAVALPLLAVAWTIGALAGAVPTTVDTGLLAVAGRSALVAAGWAMLGVAVGVAVPRQSVAVLLPLAWFLLAEPMLRAYGLHRLLPWLPGGASGAAAGAVYPGALPAWAALLVLLGWVLAVLLPGAVAFGRRDVL